MDLRGSFELRSFSELKGSWEYRISCELRNSSENGNFGVFPLRLGLFES